MRNLTHLLAACASLVAAVLAPGQVLADGSGGVLALDVDMSVQSINGGMPFPAVINPDYDELYGLGLVNTSGTYTGDSDAPDTFSYLDLPVYAIVPGEEDLIVSMPEMPEPFFPWFYGDYLFDEGEGTDMAERNFSLAPIGRLTIELNHEWEGEGIAEYWGPGTYHDDYDGGTPYEVHVHAAFAVPPGGEPDSLFYDVHGFDALGMEEGAPEIWGNDDMWSGEMGPGDNGWPGAVSDKNFFGTGGPGLPPPCPPPAYAPGGGTFRNPRFEDEDWEGDHLTDWWHDNYGDSANSLAEAVNLAAGGAPDNYAAHLRAQGEWVGDPGMEEYMRGEYRIHHDLYIPLDATQVSFMYLTRIVDDIDGLTEARVGLDPGWWADTILDDTEGAWVRFDIPVTDEERGRTVILMFQVMDEEWWPGGVFPNLDSVDLWIDYCHIDGSVPVATQAVDWDSDAGGNWDDAANWDPVCVPDNIWNAGHTAYDTLYTLYFPDPGGDPGALGAVTLRDSRTVQWLRYDRPTDFTIGRDQTLTVYDYFDIHAGRWVLEPGAKIIAGGSLTFRAGATLDASGTPGDPKEIDVGGTFYMIGLGVTRNTTIQAGRFRVNAGAELNAMAQSSLVAMDDQFSVDGLLRLTDSNIKAHWRLAVGDTGTLTVTGDSRIDILGRDLAVYGTMTMTGGEIHSVDFVGVYDGGSMELYGVDVYAAGLAVGHRLGDPLTTFYADANTHFYLNGQFHSMCDDPGGVDMTETTLHFYGAGHQHEIWAGSIAGAGEEDNVCIGTILLEDGGTLDVVKVPHWPEGNYAQYVKTLILSDASTLNLDYPIYYLNLTMGQDVTIDYPELLIPYPEPATLALLAVGALGLLVRRRRTP